MSSSVNQEFSITAETVIQGRKKAKTQTLSIPAKLTTEKKFPFKPGNKVQISFFPETGILKIAKKGKNQA